MAEQGIEFINDNDKAIISSEGLGYEFHSSQDQDDRYSVVSELTGKWETYRVNTGDSTNPPLVFVTDLGLSVEPGDSVTLSDTGKMIIVNAVKPAGTGKWDVVIRRGQDKASSSSYPITFLFFTKLPSYNPSGYGVVVYNSTGTQPVYDSTRKMLMPRVFGSYGGTYYNHSINYQKVTNYSTILAALSITRPAFMISGGLMGYAKKFFTRDLDVPEDIYCFRYHNMLHGLYSEGVVSFYGWVGHNSEEGDSYLYADSCQDNDDANLLGSVTNAEKITYMIIDADRYT